MRKFECGDVVRLKWSLNKWVFSSYYNNEHEVKIQRIDKKGRPYTYFCPSDLIKLITPYKP
jgi:hypothetical protein